MDYLDIRDGGVATVKGHTVGVILFKVQVNESAPVIFPRYCRPNYRDNIIKNLKRLYVPPAAGDQPEIVPVKEACHEGSDRT